ncbi:hypothetical protein GS480_17775 [Rhodococcus hoagii]|nr:hypothetical protein [Prescottella equi]
MAHRFLESLDSQRYAEAILPNRRVNITVEHGIRSVVRGRQDPGIDIPTVDHPERLSVQSLWTQIKA